MNWSLKRSQGPIDAFECHNPKKYLQRFSWIAICCLVSTKVVTLGPGGKGHLYLDILEALNSGAQQMAWSVRTSKTKASNFAGEFGCSEDSEKELGYLHELREI